MLLAHTASVLPRQDIIQSSWEHVEMSFYLTRRQIVAATALSPVAAALGACGGKDSPPLPLQGRIVDVHCHLFNGSDLPMTRFLKDVVLKSNQIGQPCPESDARIALDASPAVKDIDDPDLIDWLFKRIIFPLLGSATIPTAQEEIAVLNNVVPPSPKNTPQGAEEQVVAAVDGFVAAQRSAPASAGAAASRDVELLAALERAATSAGAAPARSEASRDAPAALGKALLSGDSIFARYLNWIGLFLRYRHELADELARALRNDGRRASLLVPLMVDYTFWLGETPETGSDFIDQVRCMGLIARRETGPAVHGMVSYDPLREVFRRCGKRCGAFEPGDPIGLVTQALDVHGFLGVKLYPPMGFRAIGNSSTLDYPDRVKRRLGAANMARIGADLDAALIRLYSLCKEKDAPIIAHAWYSNGAGLDYAARAEPRYWIDLLTNSELGFGDLQLCLAHQGNFCRPETAPPAGSPPEMATWEWTIGRHIRDNPGSRLYMDISYMSHVLQLYRGRRDEKEAREALASAFKLWIHECDQKLEHVVFGTDWTMVGQEAGSFQYTRTIVTFMKAEVGLDETQLRNLLSDNALRYLGLVQGEKTFERVIDFYDGNEQLISRLRRFAA